MSDKIDAVIKTRQTAAEIIAKSLVGIENQGEATVTAKILEETKNYPQIYLEGYYNPPPSGVAVIFDQKPFERLKYDSLRNESYWPKDTIKYSEERVALFYFSPVDRKTNMIGDIGCTLYKGNNNEIKKHIKKSYELMLKIADSTRVGMRFSEICSITNKLIESKFKLTRWITRNSNPIGMNLGHTIPGSYENLNFGESFKEIKDTITHKRIFIKETENFIIPETCAFTIESRLEDINKLNLPSVHFHIIVCFDKGKKTIMNNFDKIFKASGMDYMNIK